jgi:hypothetical protein
VEGVAVKVEDGVGSGVGVGVGVGGRGIVAVAEGIGVEKEEIFTVLLSEISTTYSTADWQTGSMLGIICAQSMGCPAFHVLSNAFPKHPGPAL